MSTAGRSRQGQDLVLTGGIVAIIVVFSLLPMARLLQEIVLPRGSFSLDVVASGLVSRTTWIATWHTLAVGIGGTLFSAFQRFDYDFVCAILIALISLIMAGEIVAGGVRRIFLDNATLPELFRRGGAARERRLEDD